VPGATPAARAPDVVVELGLDAGYGLSVAPTPRSGTTGAVTLLSGGELAGGRGRGTNGTHRPEGVWIEHATGTPAFASGEAGVADAAAAILRAMGLAPAELAAGAATPRAYTPEEEAIVAERLRRLGHLD
jgi:hypothetical protein